MNTSTRHIFVLLVIALVLPACAGNDTHGTGKPKRPTVKEADYVHPNFSSNFIDNIIVLPAADLRTDKSLGTDLNGKWMRGQVERNLVTRGFSVEFATIDDPRLSTPTDMDALTRDWPTVAESISGNWILIIAIHNLQRKGVISRTGVASVSGRFYDKSTGELLWEASGEGSLSLGWAMNALLDDGALEAAVMDLMQRFPLR